MRHQERQQEDYSQAQHHRHATQQQVRLLNPTRPPDRLLGHLLQFTDDFAQSRAGESLLDAPMQLFDRLDDLVRFELAKSGVGRFHKARSA